MTRGEGEEGWREEGWGEEGWGEEGVGPPLGSSGPACSPLGILGSSPGSLLAGAPGWGYWLGLELLVMAPQLHI